MNLLRLLTDLSLPPASLAARLIVLGACTAALPAAADPVARVTGGWVRGRALPGGRGAVFMGVPFAAPPVAELRWREPMPVIPWQGVRDALRPGPPAPQRSLGWNEKIAAESREDCLYLNVWTPSMLPGAALPVMVWIHGGANLSLAGGSEPIYDGTALVGHGVVLVVVEYRMGILGFLSHPELAAESSRGSCGNYGLMDQVAALEWVRANIARFGGDPGNVTVFGQSAGSMDIMALMASPRASGLFQRAICMSGSPPRGLTLPRAEAEQVGVAAARKLGAPETGAIAFLRSIPARELLERSPDLNSFTVDGWVLPESPVDAWANGREAKVPVVIGGDAIEITMLSSADDVRAAIRDTFGPAAPRALALYGLEGSAPPSADPVYGDLADRWGADSFRCPCTVHAEWHQGGGNPVWTYEFDRAVAPRPRVRHSDELPFVFGNFLAEGAMVTGAFRPGDRELSALMQAYWTNFAKTGDPNGPGLPPWPRFDAGQRSFMVFTASAGTEVVADLHGPACRLFRELMDGQASRK